MSLALGRASMLHYPNSALVSIYTWSDMKLDFEKYASVGTRLCGLLCPSLATDKCIAMINLEPNNGYREQ